MACWIITRHIFYGIMLSSCIRYAQSLQPHQHTTVTWTLVTLLGALQCLLCIWLTMICRLAYKVVSGQAAEDERSDEGSEDEEEVKRIDLNEASAMIPAQNNHSSITSPISSASSAKRKQHRR
jgi:beta-lactamase regulating signal transducer with metallopeptidase domain